MPARHHEIALEQKATCVLCSPLVKAAEAAENVMCGMGNVGKSLKPGDEEWPTGVAVLQCKFCCAG